MNGMVQKLICSNELNGWFNYKTIFFYGGVWGDFYNNNCK